MVTSEDERHCSRRHDFADRSFDRPVRTECIRGNDRGIAEVDHSKLRERVDTCLQMTPPAPACRADRAWPKAGACAVGDEVVERSANDGGVGAG